VNDLITLAHGSGGRRTRDLIERLLLPRFTHPALAELGDAATLEIGGTGLLFTTDSFVISPLEFPGGDIGKLAVCGTVNDLAVSGARPLWLSCALIIEENFAIARLERLLDSLAATARQAGVAVVCGDTKVVEHGSADGLFINTAGIGMPVPGFRPTRPRPGDCILVNGTLGDHEAAIFQAREKLGRHEALCSDCAPLNGLVAAMLNADAGGVRMMRDATRGGVGTVLNELVRGSGCSAMLDEERLPVSAPVRGLCEIVGFDPLYLANEGKLVCIAAPATATALLAAMRAHGLGIDSAIIGEVVADTKERVYLRTGFGGSRVVSVPEGAQLPRIC
jgi:hydrogenase expression/formation protein HypE